MRRLLWLLLLLFPLAGSAQTPMNLDSLMRLLPQAKEDSNQVNLLIHIGQQHEGSNLDSVAHYYLRARDLSEMLDFTPGRIRFTHNFTYLLNVKGLLDSSLRMNQEALQLAQAYGNRRLLASSLGNVGASYQYVDRLDSAVAYYLQALKIAEETDNRTTVLLLNQNLGTLYSDLGQQESSLTYLDKAVQMSQEANNPIQVSQNLLNRSVTLTRLKRFSEAIRDLEEAQKIALQTGDDYTRAHALLNLGSLYITTSQLDRPKGHFLETLSIAERMEIKELQASALRGLGSYYFFQQKPDSARYFAEKGLEAARSIPDLLQEQKSYHLLSDIAQQRGDYRGMNELEQKADSVENLMQLEQVAAKVAEYNTLYETEKKESQIRLQEAQIQQQRLNNYLLIGGILALALILILSYRIYRHRQKLQQQRIAELETEKQLLATASLLKGEEQERGRLAKDLHDGLGGMLSGIKHSMQTMKGNLIMTAENAQAFERSIDMLDSSIREMRRVAHNLMPESLAKFGLHAAMRDFCGEIHQTQVVQLSYQSLGMDDPNPLDQSASVAIYRIVQELVSNAIKHAQANQVLVQLVREKDQLHLTVEDDGVGFDPKTLDRAKGIGWENIRSRVDFLKGTIDIQSKSGQGTSVLIEIPI